jgi:hypothetical protein
MRFSNQNIENLGEFKLSHSINKTDFELGNFFAKKLVSIKKLPQITGMINEVIDSNSIFE